MCVFVGSVVEWLKRRDYGLGSKPKNTLRRFPMLGGLGKQF